MWSLGVFFGGFALGTLKIENVIRFAQCVLKVASNMIFGVVDRHSALRRGLATSVTQRGAFVEVTVVIQNCEIF